MFSVSRLNYSQVSAVKPQSVAEPSSFFQGCKSSVGTGSLGNAIKNKNADIFQNVTPIFQKENTESASHLYSKLYKEAEKIKKWKVSTDFDIHLKEKQLSEYRRTTEAQRKAIQELQLENEKLSLRLEDEYNENQGLLNQSNATRHVCDLLRDTCTRAVEKANLYENERENTMGLYGDLSIIIERMVTAFEELCVQAEKSRNELHIQIRQEHEKEELLDAEYNVKLNESKQQISELKQEKEEKDIEMSDLKVQLLESSKRIGELEDTSRNYQIELDKSNSKSQKLQDLLEEAKGSLGNIKDIQTTTQNELQNAQNLLICTNNEIKSKIHELEAVKVQHALQLSDLQHNINMLKETLTTEQKRFIERENSLQNIMLKDQETTLVPEESVKIKEGTVELHNMVDQINRQTLECISVKSLIEELIDIQKHLQNLLKIREKEVTDLKKDHNILSEDRECFSKRILELEAEIDKKELKHADLLKDYKTLLSEKEKIVRENDVIARELQSAQRELQVGKHYEEQEKKKNENMEQINIQLRNEITLLNEQLELKNEEIKNQTNMCSMEIIALRKEDEKRNKSIQDLVMEVNELHEQLNETRMRNEEIISSKQNEIEDANQRQQILSNEETVLSNTKDEVIYLKEQLKQQIEDKTLIAQETKFSMRKEMKNKKVQASLMDTPHQKAQRIDLQSHMIPFDEEKQPFSKDAKIRTLARNYMQPSQQNYTGRSSLSIKEPCENKKTPLVDSTKKKRKATLAYDFYCDSSGSTDILNYTGLSPSLSTKKQHENKKTPLVDSTKEKRKAAIAYHFHSDSSERADILEICEDEEELKKLFQMYPRTTKVTRKETTGAIFKSPGPVLKTAAMKKMREAGWTAVTKVNKRKKMKAAEKLFC
ncbi:hypothetical protein XENTR_v10005413 [Xenopus tropicalis]|nr:hypothetical protein XENTR_v10005413 [Xenopus tropicalis]